ncbi:sialin-like [Daktulosphaira vitifoliae]|uniref:sialin-like n=1 Tax=Daktulosphaira vitifoliae TaxID=58002 RepID=UPI0021AA0720|nr:sialin-like [Daktulosphaira vitifoliae]
MGGCWWPFMNVMLSNWCPPTELSYMYSVINTGLPGGIILGTVIPGMIYKNSSSDFQHSFFAIMVLCLLWSVYWLYGFYSSPWDDPRVNEEELDYLSTNFKPKLKLPVPWWYIITSLPVWSMLLANYGSTVFYTVLIYYMPIYVKSVLGFLVAENGLISAVPPIGQILVMFTTGYLSTYIQIKKLFSVTNIRKIFTFIGTIIPACILLAAPLVKQNHTFYAMMVLAYAASGAVFSGFRVTQIEMSPNFVAAITSMGDLIGSAGMNSAHFALMMFIENDGDQATWNYISLILSVLLFLCCGQFLFLSSSEVQSWNAID